MGSEIGDGNDDSQSGDSVQRKNVRRCTPDRYQPETGDRLEALKLIRSVPAPLTITRVARALAWPEHRAARWLRLFAAKGVLIPTRNGHEWRAA